MATPRIIAVVVAAPNLVAVRDADNGVRIKIRPADKNGWRLRQVRIEAPGTAAARAFRKPAKPEPSFAPPRRESAKASSTIARSEQITLQATSHGASGGAEATAAETSGSAAPL